MDAVPGAEVIEVPPWLEAELGEPDEPDELEEAVEAAVDEALAAHEACVGTSTPYALQRPLASVIIAEVIVSTTVLVHKGCLCQGLLTGLVTTVAILGHTAGQLSNEIFVAANAFVIELLATLEIIAETILLSPCEQWTDPKGRVRLTPHFGNEPKMSCATAKELSVAKTAMAETRIIITWAIDVAWRRDTNKVSLRAAQATARRKGRRPERWFIYGFMEMGGRNLQVDRDGIALSGGRSGSSQETSNCSRYWNGPNSTVEPHPVAPARRLRHFGKLDATAKHTGPCAVHGRAQRCTTMPGQRHRGPRFPLKKDGRATYASPHTHGMRAYPGDRIGAWA